jgi:hypothetical protein
MIGLTQARDRALASRSAGGGALVPMGAFRELIQSQERMARRAEIRTERREAAERMSRQLTSDYSGRSH